MKEVEQVSYIIKKSFRKRGERVIDARKRRRIQRKIRIRNQNKRRSKEKKQEEDLERTQRKT